MIKGRDWITLLAIIACYGATIGVLLSSLSLWISLPILAALIAFQSSLQHEVIHGHPFKTQWLNEALMMPSLNLLIPFARFRDTHLAHHRNENLTDPYDDPESNFLSPARWDALCRTRKAIMRINNTLLGRMILGPLVGQIYFMLGDYRLIRSGQVQIALQWVWHCGIAAIILWLVLQSQMPLWGYLVAAYAALSVLKIRTFAEHQAHEKIGGRSVIIEDRGLLALLFLNNNYHAVHHMHPQIAWYDLPSMYRARQDRFLLRNKGYRFSGYHELFRKYAVSAKDPVIHPHWIDPAE